MVCYMLASTRTKVTTYRHHMHCIFIHMYPHTYVVTSTLFVVFILTNTMVQRVLNMYIYTYIYIIYYYLHIYYD